MSNYLRESSVKLVFTIIAYILVFDLLYLILEVFEEFFFDLSGSAFLFISYSALYHFILIFIQILAIVFVFIRWYTFYFSIKDDYIINISGLIVKKKRIVNYSNISSVNYRQGILGRVFNYGDLNLELIGEGNSFVIQNIDSPDLIVNKIEKYINSRKPKGD